MVEEHNRALVCRAVEAIWNRGELDVADVLFAPDYLNHDGLIIDLVRGPEAIKLSVTLYRRAFPHFQITIVDLRAERDMVTLRWTAHSAPLEQQTTHAASPTRSTLSGTTVSRLAEGRILESWTAWDQVGVLERLGLIAPMEAPGTGSNERAGR